MVATLLHILGLLLLFSACVVALFSLVLGVPGTFLIVGISLFYAWATGFVTVQWSTIGWLLLLAVIGEGVELLSSSAAAAGARPSRRVTVGALVGALIGGIVGTPILFGIGSLLGALVGAAMAGQSEGGSLRESLVTGFAALKGRFLGFVVKAALGAAMVVIVAVAAL